MEIVEADNRERIAQARELFSEYRQTPGVDECVEGFAMEMEELPGEYGRPQGALLIALSDGVASGCVALRAIDQQTCEMKRLYVRPSARGGGVGRLLVSGIVESARRIGYSAMRLDSLESMGQAVRLYESMGFRHIAPYGTKPLSHAFHMELKLAPIASHGTMSNNERDRQSAREA